MNLRESNKRIKNLALIMIFNQIGGLLGVLIFNFTPGVLSYLILFLVSAVLCLVLLAMAVQLPKTWSNINAEESKLKILSSEMPKNVSTKIFIFGALFALFLNGDRMSDWILEPYINGISPGLFDEYSVWLQLFLLFSILGYVAALAIQDRKDKNGAYGLKSQKTLMVLLIIFAVYWILFPLVDFAGILILQAIIFFLGGISYILFLDVFMLVSQIGRSRFKGTIYQIFLALFQIGLWISVPLGVWLASIVPIKAVFMLCAVPSLISAFLMAIVSRNMKKLKTFI